MIDEPFPGYNANVQAGLPPDGDTGEGIDFVLVNDIDYVVAWPHTFAIGDRVRHVDTTPGSDPATVEALTWRTRDGRAFPTYTLFDPVTGEEMGDVLDTLDLVKA